MSKLIKKIKSMEGMQLADKVATVASDPTLAKLITYNKTGFNLPEGLPFDGEGLKFEDMTTLYMEARRLYIFSKNRADNPPDLKAGKREDLFLDMIKGMSEEEGLLLASVKDGKMCELYPWMNDL